MITMKLCTPTEKPAAAIAPLTDEETCVICKLRVMRASARKMIYDLSAEYAREFPDPEAYGRPT
jgi:hypothetical protein